MPRNLPTSTTTRVDDLFTTWVAWRAACVGVEDAYREWVTASRSDRSHAFAWYCGALDAEAELSARLAGQSAGPLVADRRSHAGRRGLGVAGGQRAGGPGRNGAATRGSATRSAMT